MTLNFCFADTEKLRISIALLQEFNHVSALLPLSLHISFLLMHPVSSTHIAVS